MDGAAAIVHFRDMHIRDRLMQEGPDWLAGGAELSHAVQVSGGRATLRVRYLQHQDLRRDEVERWTHPRTVVGRIYLTLGAAVGIRLGRRWHDLSPDEFFLLPEGVPFAAEYGRGRVLSHLFTAEDATGLPVWDEPEPARLRDPALVSALTKAWSAQTPGALDCAVHGVLLRFLEPRWSELVLREAAWRSFGPLTRMLAEDPPGAWRVERLAAGMGCSQAALSKRFRRALGLPLKHYLRRLALARAQRRMLTSSEPAARVAEALGFSDAAYFHRFFRRETGVTPSEWRRRAIGGLAGERG